MKSRIGKNSVRETLIIPLFGRPARSGQKALRQRGEEEDRQNPILFMRRKRQCSKQR